MNIEETKKAIEVMQAYVAGAEIEVLVKLSRDSISWFTNTEPQWDWISREYRIKPKPREFWVCPHQSCSTEYYNCVDHEPANKSYIKVSEVL